MMVHENFWSDWIIGKAKEFVKRREALFQTTQSIFNNKIRLEETRTIISENYGPPQWTDHRKREGRGWRGKLRTKCWLLLPRQTSATGSKYSKWMRRKAAAQFDFARLRVHCSARSRSRRKCRKSRTHTCSSTHGCTKSIGKTNT